jgi:hypothetical protein
MRLLVALLRPRHPWMIISEIVTFLIYAISMVVLPQYFGEHQILIACFPTLDHDLIHLLPCSFDMHRPLVRPEHPVHLESLRDRALQRRTALSDKGRQGEVGAGELCQSFTILIVTGLSEHKVWSRKKYHDEEEDSFACISWNPVI